MTELKHNGEHVFRVGQTLTLGETKPTTTKEEEEVNEAATKVMNALAKGILARAKDESGIRVQVAPPPPLLLKKTKTQQEIEEFYKTNSRTGESGLTMFEAPPVILAPLEKED